MLEDGQLPDWLDYKIIENKIYLWGTPQKEDEGEVVIQIIGINDFVLREFKLKVSEKKE